MPDPIYAKTPFGQQAVQDRSCCPELTPRLRALLVQVDGQKSADALSEVAKSLGAPADATHTLFLLGLIRVRDLEAEQAARPAVEIAPPAPSPDELRVQQVARLMRDAASEYLGVKAVFYNRRVDKCVSLAALKTLLAELHLGISASKGLVRADMVIKKIIALMR